MDGFRFRSLARLAVPLMSAAIATAQAPQQGGVLKIVGRQDLAPLLRLNGKSYVDVESLARITHGSLQFKGNQTILTLPGSNEPAETSEPNHPPQFSPAFLTAEIEALTQIREWRALLVNAIQNNYPLSDNWIDALRRAADAKLELAAAAARTGPDQKVLGLLRNEFANMKQMSDQFLAIHDKADYIPPDSFANNPLNQKILNCEEALASMAATKQFQDEAACH